MQGASILVCRYKSVMIGQGCLCVVHVNYNQIERSHTIV